MIKTDWDNVAPWYDAHLEDNKDSFQAQVIAPNLMRMLSLKKGDVVLDLACGQGYFARLAQQQGATLTGVDLSRELIARAKEKSNGISYIVAPADDTKLRKESFDKVFTVLAFENIKNNYLVQMNSDIQLKAHSEVAILPNPMLNAVFLAAEH